MKASVLRKSGIAAASVVLLLGFRTPAASEAEIVDRDDFESGLGSWTLPASQSVKIVTEPGVANRVLELTPAGVFPLQGTRGLSYALLRQNGAAENLRMEGRFRFPTDGDGYLGFIYNYRTAGERSDFGVIYVKSNGSYVRVSPHYDGNPSWRLYEYLRVDLDGERRIRAGAWYPFRLDVRGRCAALFVGDFTAPAVSFDQFPYAGGALGLEARPGNGDRVWVDDITVSRLPGDGAVCPEPERRESRLYDWEALGPMDYRDTGTIELPDLEGEPWRGLSPDSRGAIVTGLLTQTASGNKDTAYVRARFEAGANPEHAWLAVSTANRLDVWLNGFYRGTVAADRFAWPLARRSTEAQSARLPLAPRSGTNEILIRVHGDRFAGGGFYADVVSPE